MEALAHLATLNALHAMVLIIIIVFHVQLKDILILIDVDNVIRHVKDVLMGLNMVVLPALMMPIFLEAYVIIYLFDSLIIKKN